MKVADILQKKGFSVYSVNSETTVYEALQIMSEKNIGALLVIDDEQLSGIMSERDYARKIILKGKTSQDTLVKEIMTANPISVTPKDSLENCMELMSQKHIRHLPVTNDNEILGMISIGDVVKSIIHQQQETIDYLQSYIAQ
ncbi:MAG: CBS domain-containing protein [Chitinophagaceae bacterium]